MKETYANTQKLYSITLRTPKECASFLYFLLESHEGICFYSTLDASLGTSYRDIHMQGSIEFYSTIKEVLESFAKQHKYEIIEEKKQQDVK